MERIREPNLASSAQYKCYVGKYIEYIPGKVLRNNVHSLVSRS